MCIVDDAEVALGTGTCSTERIHALRLFVADDLHVVAAAIVDAVGTYLIIIGSGRLQSREADKHHIGIHVGHAVSATIHLLPVGQVGLLTVNHIAIGFVGHTERHSHAVLCIVLQHGFAVDKLCRGLFALFLLLGLGIAGQRRESYTLCRSQHGTVSQEISSVHLLLC